MGMITVPNAKIVVAAGGVGILTIREIWRWLTEHSTPRSKPDWKLKQLCSNYVIKIKEEWIIRRLRAGASTINHNSLLGFWI